MKRIISLISLFMILSFFVKAQTRPYNVVFDLTSNDSSDQKAVIRWLKGIKESNPAAKLEVVLYGKSLDMVTEGKSVAANDVKDLANDKNISFKVCEIAMKHHNLQKDQLMTGVQTVPDGIYEIITKEGEGWGYIKVAH